MERKLFARNALLGAVEPKLRQDVAKRLALTEMARGNVLYSPGKAVDRVFFPVRGLIGIVADTVEGGGMDSAIVGVEGGIGLFEACGSRQFFAEAVVQVDGQAAVMNAGAYRDLFAASPAMRSAIHRYVEQLMNETRQAVVCGALHDLEARLSRLILEALERSGTTDTLAVTQETLARMLGAQRTTVAELLSRLHRLGCLTTRRGAVIVTDRPALEAFACSCRASIVDTRAAIWAAPDDACESALAAAE
jgi:CRP-like cAMP-binding protein